MSRSWALVICRLLYSVAYPNGRLITQIHMSCFRLIANVLCLGVKSDLERTVRFNVPLPSEAEILQTSGIPSAGSGGKMKGKNQIVKSIGAAAAMAMGYRPYLPCAPELYVHIFHRLDESKSAESTLAPMTSSSESLHVSALRT
ncbi:hypothetical protein PsorP6_005138 [Peronosclerospora sorghi]|uniref:Uncharacterized protein n=1 Tax=Peronosclerospora sorghi TaxID=230839 RepID=A0ACC0W4I0_9STRA|nr:hypothetical protein PsorP6_005138 [Peronosclerospora sorghi]